MSSEDKPDRGAGAIAPVEVDPSDDSKAKELPSSPKLRRSGSVQQAVKCIACDAYNSFSNLHCEYCGARLPHHPWPNPQPMDSDAARTLRAAAVGIAVVFVVVGLVWMTNRGDSPTALTPVPDPENGIQSPPPPSGFADLQEISPQGVTASSEHSGFPATNLVDGDPSSAWLDDSLGGQGAELTFTFGGKKNLVSVTLTSIEDPARFHRNFRIRNFEIRSSTSDEPIIGELADEPGPQTVQLPAWATSQVTLKVLTTYAAEPIGDRPSTQDLALNEVSFTDQTPPAR